MKFCGNCGQSIPDDARACPYCGAMQTGGPAAPAKKGFDFKEFFQKNKKLIMIIGGVIVAALVIWGIISLISGGSSKETPLERRVDYLTAEEYDAEDQFINMYDGFGDSQLKDIYKILSSSENWDDAVEVEEDSWSDIRDDFEDQFGENFKISYEITREKELDKDDLKDLQEEYFEEEGDALIEMGKYISKLDNSDLKELAEDMGLEKDQVKELADLLKDLGKVLKEAELDEGYELKFKATIKGSDDKDTNRGEMTVVQVGSDWVDVSNIRASALRNYFYGVGYWEY